jgi:long-subunit acyl-CoA synthetase (AMP-forming)
MVEMSIVSGVGQPAAHAIVVLAEDLRPRLGDAAVRGQVDAAMQSLLAEVNSHLPDYAQLRMIVIAGEPWTIENGCLTPTMKLKRAKIEALTEPKVAAWYADPRPVQWG